MEGKAWRVESPAASTTDNIEQATLALRLGIAVNAMRAVQKFFYNFRDAPGPAGERDRRWAFLIAMGYLKEAVSGGKRAGPRTALPLTNRRHPANVSYRLT